MSVPGLPTIAPQNVPSRLGFSRTDIYKRHFAIIPYFHNVLASELLKTSNLPLVRYIVVRRRLRSLAVMLFKLSLICVFLWGLNEAHRRYLAQHPAEVCLGFTNPQDSPCAHNAIVPPIAH